MTDDLRDAVWQAIALTEINEHPELRQAFAELGTISAEQSVARFHALSEHLAVPPSQPQTRELSLSPFWRN